MTQSIRTGTVQAAPTRGLSSYAPMLVVVAATVQAAIGLVTSTVGASLADKSSTAFVSSGVALTITHVMVLAGVVGLYGTTAARAGWLKRIAFGVAYVGLAAQVLGESVLRVNFDLGNAFFGIALPATGLGMVLVGIAILTGRAWSGWHRYAALISGVYVPAVLIPAFIVAKGPSFIGITGWSCCFLALGLAMRAEQNA